MSGFSIPKAPEGRINFLALRGYILSRLGDVTTIEATAQAIAEALEGPLGELLDYRRISVVEMPDEEGVSPGAGLYEIRCGGTCFGYVDGPIQQSSLKEP